MSCSTRGTRSAARPQRNALSDALAARGATIFTGHDAAHIAGAEALVVTSAVKLDHPELRAASERGIPVLKRADLWREWSGQRDVVAVAGTHGKTTTTAVIALALTRAGRDPGYLIGGEAPDLPRNARWGDPRAPLVIEADEYDRTFLALAPRVAVINVEWDHVDIYPSPEEYDAAFRAFAASVRSPSDLIICGDDPGAPRVVEQPEATQYGIDDAVASDPVSCRRAIGLDGRRRARGGGRRHDLRGLALRPAQFRDIQPGAMPHPPERSAHNVRNALAALAATSALGVAPERTIAVLAEYRGTAALRAQGRGRRRHGDRRLRAPPTEVRVNLSAARERYPGRRIIVYLQPHTYSRTHALLDTWAGAFDDADIVRIGEIYAARARYAWHRQRDPWHAGRTPR